MFSEWLKFQRESGRYKKKDDKPEPAEVPAKAPRKKPQKKVVPEPVQEKVETQPSFFPKPTPSFWEDSGSPPPKRRKRVKAPMDAVAKKKGHCRKCDEWVVVKNPQHLTSKNGAAYIKGTCPKCSKAITSFVPHA